MKKSYSVFVEDVKRAAILVDLVQEYSPLKRTGRRYRCKCPFHDDPVPSFFIWIDTNSFYCFGCGQGGDAITFTMKISKLSFWNAVCKLADRYGIPKPKKETEKGNVLNPFFRPMLTIQKQNILIRLLNEHLSLQRLACQKQIDVLRQNPTADDYSRLEMLLYSISEIESWVGRKKLNIANYWDAKYAKWRPRRKTVGW